MIATDPEAGKCIISSRADYGETWWQRLRIGSTSRGTDPFLRRNLKIKMLSKMIKEEESQSESTEIFKYPMASLCDTKKEAQCFKEVFPPLPTKWSGEDPESVRQIPHIISQKCVTCQVKSTKQQQAEEQKERKLRHEYYLQQFRTTSFAVFLSVSKLTKKPRTLDPIQQSLKWQRLKHLINSLSSPVLLERKDAAKALQSLQCTNMDIVSALYTTLQTDEDSVVRFEAAKALVRLGCWEEEVVLKLIQVINQSPGKLLEDIIITLRKSLRDWASQPSHMRPEIKAKDKLILLFRSFITTLRSKDMISVQATACLCYLNRNDKAALDYIISYLHSGTSYQKKQALEVVLRFLQVHDSFSIRAILEQLQNSPVYKHRLKALDLLSIVGTPHIIEAGMYQAVFEALKQKLWDDPVLAVRQRAALVINMLKMKKIVWMDMEQQLEDNDAEIRGRAVISLSVLGLPSNKVLRLLLEMLEIDLSQYVRFQIIRAFARLHLNDVQVKRSLFNRQLGEGPLAREAHKALKSLEKKSEH